LNLSQLPELCEENIATCHCEECQENSCEECFKSKHNTKKYQKHHQKPILNLEIFPKCLIHTSKVSDFFCLDDNSCICSSCAILNHNGHKCVEIKEGFSILKKEIQRNSTIELENFQDSVEEVEEMISLKTKKYEKDDFEIQELIQKLEEKKKKLGEIFKQNLSELESSKLKLNEICQKVDDIRSKSSKETNILNLIKFKNELVAMTPKKNIKSKNCFMKGKQTVYGFGYNLKGQLGNGTNNNEFVPVKIFTDENIESIACGNSHTLMLKGFEEIQHLKLIRSSII
jgi:hypothetical protein